MDPFLVRYLRSGRAWVLVGSGPSTSMGYPSWAALSQVAIQTAAVERPDFAEEPAQAALIAGDYPRVMQIAADALGLSRLRERLRAELRPREEFGAIYRELARWAHPCVLNDKLRRRTPASPCTAAASL